MTSAFVIRIYGDLFPFQAGFGWLCWMGWGEWDSGRGARIILEGGGDDWWSKSERVVVVRSSRTLPLQGVL